MTIKPKLLPDERAQPSGPVVCLGMEFANEEERRAYFTERLREHLQVAEFRAIEGFPIGTDEDILALSDPPYYTACPNPFLPQILAEWQEQRAALHETMGLDDAGYHREPFATDVSEGKTDPIYTAHSYHTKVPHKAIMRYILHYTEPGDVVFDGFCGTGMTGVAAQLCGDRMSVENLGYRIDPKGTISDGVKPIALLGARRAVLNDLSPIATFIAYNYNNPIDMPAFESIIKSILSDLATKTGWMYQTWHPNVDNPSRISGRMNYTVWSEVFGCPTCSHEIVFVREALDAETMRVKDEFLCPGCQTILTKRQLTKVYEREFDPILESVVENIKRVPIFLEYEIGGTKYSRPLDASDKATLNEIELLPNPRSFPSTLLPYMHMTHERARMDRAGITHLHHFFLKRTRETLGYMWWLAQDVTDTRLRHMIKFTIEQAVTGMSLMNRFQPIQYGKVGGSQVNRFMSGVYYVGSQIAEVSPWYILEGKVERLIKAFKSDEREIGNTAISTNSTTAFLAIPEASIDYIFTDPPFGENIYYSDLNYFLESWHGVWTNSQREAIIDRARQKALVDYQSLMRKCFETYYRALKPGRWMTVEFHNSHDAVWRAIQEALMSVGFVVADVRTLDKQQGSYRQVTSDAAKQDLIISAYKPTAEFVEQFISYAGTEPAVWGFVRQHLAQLPRVVQNGTHLETIAERQNYLLFDRMVAYHIQRGVAVPISAAQFYAGLTQRFSERDGMYFLPEQVAEYDQARLAADQVENLVLFVSDEKSAITWLRMRLTEEAQSFQEIQPRFLQELHQARHEDLPDLRVLLEQNFIQDEEGRWFVPDPTKAEDLEKLRLRDLLREFDRYQQSRGRLTNFRTEAVRAGFAQAWKERNYALIVQLAERLPEAVLQEDADLLMYYDNASLRA